jgi:hypothetical protein
MNTEGCDMNMLVEKVAAVALALATIVVVSTALAAVNSADRLETAMTCAV